jgi:hypothetical protein
MVKGSSLAPASGEREEGKKFELFCLSRELWDRIRNTSLSS